MAELIDINPSVLASLLESIADSDGVLVCRDQIPVLEDDAICRAFSIFMFEMFSSDDEGLSFSHADSGTTLTYNGIGVKLIPGGQLTEAIPDLLKALHSLSWRNADVYSIHGEALYEDLAGNMPASIDIQLMPRDIPADANLDADVANFSAAVAGGGAAAAASDTDFLSVFRAGNNLPPATLAAPEIITPPPAASEGMGIGVHVNYIPDSFDPLDTEPRIPEEMPSLAAVAPPAETRRPVITLDTASPVAGAVRVPAATSSPSPAPSPARAPASEAKAAAPMGGEGLDSKGGNGDIAQSVVRQVVVAPSLASSSLPLASDSDAASGRGGHAKIHDAERTHGTRASVPCPSGPVALGDAIIVLDAPWDRLSAERLAALAAHGGVHHDVVRYEPGTVAREASGAVWDVLAELPSGADDGDAARSLVAALWPDLRDDHLLILSLLLMLKVERGDEERHAGAVWSDLLAVAQLDADELLGRLFRATDQGGLLGKLVVGLRSTIVSSIAAGGLGRLGMSLWAFALRDTCPTGGRASPALSFTPMAAGGDSRVVVISVDALDKFGVGEFLAAGAMRWAAVLSETRRGVGAARGRASEAERAAEAVMQGLDPQVIAALERRILSLKIGAVAAVPGSR